MIATNAYPALLLNADYRPVSYHPLSLMTWKEAVRDVVLGRVHVAAEYDAHVSSPMTRIRLPAVVVLSRYVRQPDRPPLSRMNIWLRDGGRCAYCNCDLATEDLTFDHVLPRSRGGGSGWTNIVSACAPDNFRKAARTPAEAGMHLLWEPREPSGMDLARNARKLGRAIPVREEWADFVYWDAALETP